MDLLSEQLRSYENISVEFKNVSRYMDKLEFKNMLLTKNTYSKLLIPYIFADYDRIIYLDCDILCLSDVSNLLNEPPDGFMLGAVRDHMFIWKKPQSNFVTLAKELGLKNTKFYFNAGVLVFNNKEFRKNIDLEDLMNTSVSRYWTIVDQDILNYVCKDKVYYLRVSWNMMSDTPLKYILPEFRKSCAEAKEKPGILHFLITKPWNCCIMTDWRVKFFWEYARKTPFFNAIFNNLADTCFKSSSSPEEKIYDNLRNIRYNLRFIIKFIMKCLYLWIKWKLKYYAR